MTNDKYPFINYPLDYSYNALEPFIDQKTMELHHDYHLKNYITQLNEILKENPALSKLSLTQLLENINELPLPLYTAIKNNAGGVFNHRFYFDGLKNTFLKTPTSSLLKAINKRFGSYENFKENFIAVALTVFGSGYVWLVFKEGDLKIITTQNQDTPLSFSYCVLLNLDLWEHAYYLKNYGDKIAYIDNWFNVINWAEINKRYINCKEI